MLVERQLGARRGLKLRFSRELELRFEAETAPGRSRMLFLQGVAGTAFYLFHSVTDFALIPDVAPLALVIHIGIALPLGLIALVMLWFNPPPTVRESLVVAMGLVAGLVTLALMLLSASPLRDELSGSTVAVLLFTVLVQRVRFPYAVLACLVLVAANAIALNLLPGYEGERLVSRLGTLGGCAILMLIASWTLEHEIRQSYLLRLRERLANSALSDLSQRDPMTGLENRRALDLAFASLSRHANKGEDVAVVLVDIDHFKAYNDTRGHMAGDDALRLVANELQAGLRTATDRAFRFGGEEFLLLLRRTSLGEAMTLAERLRQRIEAAALPHPQSPGRFITASFGVAATRVGSDVSSDELVAGADAALYAAKRGGRNQVWPPLAEVRPLPAAQTPPGAQPERDAS
jgi:diguanylate cyclase (GGDEF)-like protein